MTYETQAATELYRERVGSPGWFVLAVRMVALGPLAAAAGALRDPEVQGGGRFAAVVGPLLAALALAAVSVWFVALEVAVTRDALRFRFGPFGRTLSAEAVEDVRVEPYSALRFGGWGWRFGFQRGRATQAYTVPFLRTGVEVTTREGKTFYISSQSPERLAEAIEAMQRPSST